MENERVGMFEAKIRFSEIVDRVLREGCAVTVTRHGRPVVDISPIIESARQPRTSRVKALATLEGLRGQIPKMSRQEIGELIENSHRRDNPR